MEETDAERLALKTDVLKELAQHKGHAWKEVYCEVHPQFSEMVFWVLLYEDYNLHESHKIICNVLEKYIERISPTPAALSYDMFSSGSRFCVERLKGNEDVVSALEKDSFGTRGFLLKKPSSIFFSTDSMR